MPIPYEVQVIKNGAFVYSHRGQGSYKYDSGDALRHVMQWCRNEFGECPSDACEGLADVEIWTRHFSYWSVYVIGDCSSSTGAIWTWKRVRTEVSLPRVIVG